MKKMPMEQFEIKGIIAPIIIGIIIMKNNSTKIIPSNYQILDESLYRSILLIILNNLNLKSLYYFPLIYTIFIIILLSNLIGLIPYSTTPSVEIVITLSLAITILGGILIYALIVEHGLYIFHLFLPAGTPIGLIPLMVPLEIVAYITRTLSLG
jgi:F-type H+-transporting ATPase subunit a